ncbi:MAG: GNAT family N-acetyltransferase [Actinomycetota bacterium]
MSSSETERLLLRPPHPSDVDQLAVIFAKPEVFWFSFKRGLDRRETEEWVDRHRMNWRERGLGRWLAIVKETGAIIGYRGLSVPVFLPEIMPAVELGYRLDPAYWHHGYATEGAREALRFGFEERALDRIYGIYEPENVASGRVMERLGMTFDRDTVVPEGEITVRVMAITQPDWVAPR